MLIGETIMPGETVYTPSAARGGSKGIFSVSTLKVNAGSLYVAVQHKNFSDNTEASWAPVGTTVTITTATTAMLSRDDLKEQVRLKFIMSSGSSDWVRVFTYEPTWED